MLTYVTPMRPLDIGNGYSPAGSGLAVSIRADPRRSA
jgi:hypothetical protein